MGNILPYLILGLAAGVCGGLLGIGGGIIMIPALIFIFKFSQQQAQGTSLAVMIPPIGLLAAYTYYQKGLVDIRVAVLICVGFLLGGWLGGKLATSIPNAALQMIFGIFLLVIGTKLVFFGK
jgi:uncharacterized membrane protein YfcA